MVLVSKIPLQKTMKMSPGRLRCNCTTCDYSPKRQIYVNKGPCDGRSLIVRSRSN
jgi:hypothetical protein